MGGFYFDETEFNSLGYALAARDMIDAAIEVFRINVEMNPESSNAYDSLGEAYILKGDTGAAISNYRKALELDPENTNAAEMLDRLEPRVEPDSLGSDDMPDSLGSGGEPAGPGSGE